MKRIFVFLIVFFVVINSLYTAEECPPGQYLGFANCWACSTGNYCPGGTAGQFPCDAGYFCPSDGTYGASTSHGNPIKGNPSDPAPEGCEEDCEYDTVYHVYICGECPCPVGQYCDGSDGTTTGAGNCAPGYYCPETSTTNHGRPVVSSSFSRFIDGVDTPITCSGSATEDCICPAGTRCPDDADRVLAPISCPAGEYQPNSQQSICLDCNSGYYCPNVGNTFETNCTAGYYCPDSNMTAVDTENNVCDAGYFCPETSRASTGQPVLPPEGVTGCGTDGHDDCACPGGTYNSLPGQDELADCLACVSGQYCPPASTSNPTCEIGYFCPSITLDHQLCTPGYHCPDPGMTGVGLNNLCVAGFFCPEGSTQVTGAPVNPTTGCTSTGIGDGTDDCPCSAGHYCPVGSQAINGRPITTAYIQNNIGTTFTCLENTACPCLAGNMCPFNSTVGTSAPTACTIGYYQNAPAQSSCIICPAGSLCPYEEMSTPESCPSQTTSEEGAIEISNCYIDTATTIFIDDNGADTGLTLNQILGDVDAVLPDISEANKCYYNDIPSP